MTKTNLSKLLTVVFSLLLLTIVFFYGKYYNAKIKRKHKITTGYIHSIKIGHRSGMTVNYYYSINGTLIYDKRTLNKSLSYRDDFVDRSFPVIYSFKDSTFNRMLIWPSEFEAFGLNFPDSLKWVKKYE